MSPVRTDPFGLHYLILSGFFFVFVFLFFVFVFVVFFFFYTCNFMLTTPTKVKKKVPAICAVNNSGLL